MLKDKLLMLYQGTAADVIKRAMIKLTKLSTKMIF